MYREKKKKEKNTVLPSCQFIVIQNLCYKLSSVFCVPKCKKGNGLQYLRRHIRVELSSDEENNKNTTSEKTYSLFLF